MDAPDTRRLLDRMPQGLTGAALDRPEGPLKVSGRATYAHEFHLDDCAHGVLVRATITKGRVLRIDGSSITDLEGVLGVFTGERFLRNPAQGMANEAPVQGASEVAYFGQPIAMVVAETFEQARHAAQLLSVDYAPDADALTDPRSEAVKIDKPDAKQLDQGDLDAAMADAAATVDALYTTPAQSNAPMEPHASIAQWDGDTLTLHGSYQMLKYNRNELADSLGIDPEKIRILSPYVGGGFGAKLGIAPEAVAAALAAREIGRPVKIAMTRQHVFDMTVRRCETHQRLRLAADADGRLTGIGHEYRVSNLPGETFSEPVAQATHFLYGGQNRRIVHEIARVHRTCAGSMRAPGEAVGMLALENAMDELAETLGLDPIELRKRNLPERDPEKDVPYSTRAAAECLDEGARRFGWEKRAAEPGAVREGEWLIGMGVATAARKNVTTEAEARVTLRPDGTALVETDMTDIGTGTYAILGQIAGDLLGLPRDRVEVQLGDTRLPPGSGSGGSIGASSTGSAVLLACEALRETLCERFECDPDELTLKDGEAIAGNRRAPLTDLVGDAPLTEQGKFKPGKTTKETSQAAYGAFFAEVAVSHVTGEVRVRRMLGVFAAGRILNAKTARSQCLGGMVFGIGSALTEELVHDSRDGHIVNRDLAEYHLPVNLDVPQIDVHFLEERDDWACPLQSKGIGELGISGAGAAITNAIHNATGARIRSYPATLDKVLEAVEALE
ncbi:xanthine dehydrogenase family protein molybdopterin-binding subunit [Sphingosinithalassobacter sp. LHW66-3]|uniref:xanthine dehydrogenase family protein molybdopterin-binding subunit n=1 Tax=Sphingosinithalassobacter sp. LHW66-3 TaxID=3424718 RepID=UPI003D6A93EF